MAAVVVFTVSSICIFFLDQDVVKPMNLIEKAQEYLHLHINKNPIWILKHELIVNCCLVALSDQRNKEIQHDYTKEYAVETPNGPD